MPRRGPLASICLALSRLSAGGAALILLIWLIGRVASDHWRWSQYLLWIPEEALLASAALLTLIAWPLWRLCGRRAARPRPRLLRLAAFGTAALILHLLLIHWRVQNYITRSAPHSGSLRILNWNTTAIEHDEHITGTLFPQNADIIVIANPMNAIHWPKVGEEFGRPAKMVWFGGFLILSRPVILRYGILGLGIQGAMTEAPPGLSHIDNGRAMFLEFDTTAQLGRTTTVWVIDLPSDWRMSRWAMAGRAAAAISSWTGAEFVRNEEGAMIPHQAGPGFPAADIILGDFNSPRGSASQRLIVGSMAEAFDQAGAGYSATWPAYPYHTPIPVFQLDHTFLAPWLRATRYDLIAPVFGFHKPQVVDIMAR